MTDLIKVLLQMQSGFLQLESTLKPVLQLMSGESQRLTKFRGRDCTIVVLATPAV
jgi:hypothetical protein